MNELIVEMTAAPGSPGKGVDPLVRVAIDQAKDVVPNLVGLDRRPGLLRADLLTKRNKVEIMSTL